MVNQIRRGKPGGRSNSIIQHTELADKLEPEYARILRNVPLTDGHKIKIVNQLRIVIGQVVQAYLEEKLGLTERDY